MINQETPEQPAPSAQLVPPIGQYFIAGGTLTAIQAAQAVRIATRRRMRIGEVLLEQGHVSPVALADALVTQALDRRLAQLPARYLGERLLGAGIILPDQLAAALCSQFIQQRKGVHVMIGKLLVTQGVVAPEQLEAIRAASLHAPTPAAAPADPITSSRTEAAALLPATALVLEDDMVLSKVITTLLRRLPTLQVLALSRIAEARVAVAAAPPRLLLTDRRLPDGDGLAFATELRQRSPGTAIVVMTADSSPALFELLRICQLHQFVAKPFTAQTLITTINAALAETA